MASKEIEIHREGAEIYHGAALCKQKIDEFMEKHHLPKKLMPLTKLVEVGFNPTTKFAWLKQEKPTKYKRKGFGICSYASETTMFIEDGRIRKLTGVKSKELMIWITISDITVDPTEDKITFTAPMGLSKSYPLTDVLVEAVEIL